MLFNLCWRDWEKFTQKHKLFVLFFCCYRDSENYHYCVNLISQIYSERRITFARMEWCDARNICIMYSIRSYNLVCVLSNKKLLWMNIYPTMAEIKRGLKHAEDVALIQNITDTNLASF